MKKKEMKNFHYLRFLSPNVLDSWIVTMAICFISDLTFSYEFVDKFQEILDKFMVLSRIGIFAASFI